LAKFIRKSVVPLCCLVVIVVAVAVPARAFQKDKEADEQKELDKKTLVLLNDMAAGAWGLKLPENRLFIMSNAADLMWPTDEKRARTIYWDALNTLSLMTPPVRRSAQKLSQEERIKIVQSYLAAFELRQKLLQHAAKRDAQLALDMLRASRPVTPRNLLPQFTLPDDLQLEQAIAAELAARDPAQALQIARQSLAKGISYELLNILQRLNNVDSEKGSQFAGEIIAKLGTIDLATDYHGAMIGVQLLHLSRKPDPDQKAFLGSASGGGKALNLDDEQKRDLVVMLTDVALSATVAPHVVWQVFQIMREIEQFYPERGEALAKKVATFNRNVGGAPRGENSYDSVISREALDALQRYLGMPDRPISLYEAAIAAVAQGKSDWFRDLINKEVKSAETKAQLLDLVDSEEISLAAYRKQFDRMRELLPNIRDKVQRARAMGELALMLHEKGEKEEAVSLLDEAASLIKTDLKDDKQTNALMTLMCAYAVIDPPKAFALAERTVDRANSQISLLLLLDKVARSGAVKKNEILLEQPQLMTMDFLVFKYGKGVAALAKADFVRTRALAERFDRNELRLMAQLFILRGLLDPQPAAPSM
jgi:hypothetical protein